MPSPNTRAGSKVSTTKSVSMRFLEDGMLDFPRRDLINSTTGEPEAGPMYSHGLVMPPRLPSFLEAQQYMHDLHQKYRRQFDAYNTRFHGHFREESAQWRTAEVDGVLGALEARCYAHTHVLGVEIAQCRNWLDTEDAPQEKYYERLAIKSCMNRNSLLQDQISQVIQGIGSKRGQLTTSLCSAVNSNSRKAVLALTLVKPVLLGYERNIRDPKVIHEKKPHLPGDEVRKNILRFYTGNTQIRKDGTLPVPLEDGIGGREVLAAFPTVEYNLVDCHFVSWILGRDEHDFYNDPRNWVPMDRTSGYHFMRGRLAFIPVAQMTSRVGSSCTDLRCEVFEPDPQWQIDEGMSYEHHSDGAVMEKKGMHYRWPNHLRPYTQSLYLHYFLTQLVTARLHYAGVEFSKRFSDTEIHDVWPAPGPYLRKSFVEAATALVGMDPGIFAAATFDDGSSSDCSRIQVTSENFVKDLAMTMVHRMTQIRLDEQERKEHDFQPLRDEDEVPGSDLSDDDKEIPSYTRRELGIGSQPRWCYCAYHTDLDNQLGIGIGDHKEILGVPGI
ncbi:MAG: hypothetical protein M1831_002129 [Alyxoria varia]|nr:MAG: hypothetical protein M1831_002129 [Alyxoria varia]